MQIVLGVYAKFLGDDVTLPKVVSYCQAVERAEN